MNQDELHNLVERRGHQARVTRDEVLVKECVFCGNPRWNLELNAEKSVYHCWACRSSGRLDDFLAEYLGRDVDLTVDVEADHYDPDNVDQMAYGFEPGDLDRATELVSTRRYLENRGLGVADIYKYDIQVCTNPDYEFKGQNLHGYIVIPVRQYWSGEEFGYVARKVAGNGPKYVHVMPTTEICGFRGQGGPDSHIVTEGIFDGIRVSQAGYQAAVLLGISTTELEEWAGLVPDDEAVLLALDGDAQEKAERLKHRLSMFHPDVYRVPFKEDEDPGDLTPEELNQTIQEIRTNHGI